MEERVSDFTNSATGHNHVLVNLVRVVSDLATKEADWLVVAPAAMPDLFAEEVVPAGNPERNVVARQPHSLTNLGGKLRCTAFVGVENQHPWRLYTVYGVVSRRADGGELRTYYRGTGAPRAVNSVVDRVVLDDDYLTRPIDARNTGFDVRGFVVSRDHRRDVRGAAALRAHPRRLRVRALLAARSNPSIMSVSGNSRATLILAARPIA